MHDSSTGVGERPAGRLEAPGVPTGDDQVRVGRVEELAGEEAPEDARAPGEQDAVCHGPIAQSFS